MMFVLFNSNTVVSTSGAGTVYPPGTHTFTLDRWVRGAHCTGCSSIYDFDYTVSIGKLYLTIISYVINILKLW